MDFYIPEFTNDVHYEVEVLVKIDKVGRGIEPKLAHTYYSEIGLGIDFTARDIQNELKAKGLPWEKAKAFDGSAVIGEFLPKTQFSSLENLTFELTNNGQTVQKGCSSHMLWAIDELIAYVSQFVSLKVGDLIYTGTPEGVGPVKIGDVLEGEINGKPFLNLEIK